MRQPGPRPTFPAPLLRRDGDMRSVLVLAVSALLVAAAEPARSGPIMTCDLQSDCLQVIGATEAHE